jgi:hypothetical protein
MAILHLLPRYVDDQYWAPPNMLIVYVFIIILFALPLGVGLYKTWNDRE